MRTAAMSGESRCQQILSLLKRVCCFFLARLREDRLMAVASTLTFTTLLSLVPLLSVVFAVVGSLPGFNEIEQEIRQFIFSHLVPTSTTLLKTNLDQFIQRAGQLSWAGTAMLLVTALLTMATIERSFNLIWRVKQGRKGVSAFMLYWAVLTLAPLCIGLSLALSSYLLSLPLVTESVESAGVLKGSLIGVFSYALEMVAFTLLYWAVPHQSVKFRHAFFGGVLVTLLFEFGKGIFALYITHFTTYEVLYGALASIPVFLLWIYISWLLILLGAEFVSVLGQSGSWLLDGNAHPFVIAYLCLESLFHGQRQGEAVTHEALVERVHGQAAVVDEVLATLKCCHLIYQVNHSGWILARDLHELSVFDLYQQLPWKLPEADEVPAEAVRLAEIVQSMDEASRKALSQPLVEQFQFPMGEGG